jgi:hypothetical protein
MTIQEAILIVEKNGYKIEADLSRFSLKEAIDTLIEAGYKLDEKHQTLREAPLMGADAVAKNTLYITLNKWLENKDDNRTLTGCLQDYVAGQNVGGKSPFVPAVYKTKHGDFISQPPKEINKEKVVSTLEATKPNSKERRWWVDEVISVLKRKFKYGTKESVLSDKDYEVIDNFFFNIEENSPEDFYTPETT